ncbi:MAG TPA: DUF3445 domain-containing protein [Acidimicrobiales bacterium]|jgi:hypothetical protein|nr:DUF3445 domain-containing protein [Acidimicrobiales bacterium]
MGTSRTSETLTPIGNAAEKRRILDQHRDDVLAAVDDVLLAPLERAALRVEEDLCVLVDARLAGGCVCAPSHWRLRDKLGLPITEVHQRVPGYRAELASKVDAFLRRLTTATVVGRRNFTVHERPDLYAPVAPDHLGVDPSDQWLRSERQTLRRLPRSDAVLFTIRTQQVQLKDLDEEVRRRLGARLRAEPDELIAYRDLRVRLPALIAYLSP